MNAAIVAFSKRGSELGKKIAVLLNTQGYQVKCYAPSKYCSEKVLPIIGSFSEHSKQLFVENKLLVYIGATGIAVRAISPWVRDKTTDPAVVCLDELGKFAIPILSGHIGGANEIASQIAAGIDSTPVITTATDIHNLIAIDEWATKNNLHIVSMPKAKLIAANLVDGQQIGLYTDYPIEGNLPRQFTYNTDVVCGVVISDNCDYSPFKQTLFLLPKRIFLGIGCRRNTDTHLLEEFVFSELQKLNLSMNNVAGLASIDLKKDEPALLNLAGKYKLSATFYSAEQLNTAPGEFSSSAFVRNITGVDNVCERSAFLLGNSSNFLLRKVSFQGMTLAVVKQLWTVNFE